ncbi:uncharacterized protein LOC125537501 isoform X3 [Triticum urartu]|uniref:uncharacterized protein LOC125537501 isoform X3 n=1 Tax=Triticum urartu TaxID=4572 RepID=UPI002043D2B1|nr:uncharacterized protein LOC125537501 isoform X3 [Triticum urartu]
MVTAAAVQCGQTDGCATAFCASWAASARAEDRTAARRPMAAAAEPRDTVFAAGRCHAGHRPLAAAAAVCYAPGRLIEKDAGPECILGHAGAVVHGRLGVQRWEQPGRRMSPLREEPSRDISELIRARVRLRVLVAGSLKGPPSRSRTRPPFQPEGTATDSGQRWMDTWINACPPYQVRCVVDVDRSAAALMA